MNPLFYVALGIALLGFAGLFLVRSSWVKEEWTGILISMALATGGVLGMLAAVTWGG